jgi:hypothetical protein
MVRSRPRPVHPLLLALGLVPLVIAFALRLEWAAAVTYGQELDEADS